MQVNNILGRFLVFLFTCLAFNHSFAESGTVQGNPVALLQYIANNMIAGLKENKATLKSKPQIVYNLASKYVVPYADLSVMSKRVIPPHVWNNASTAQRVQFQKQFTTIIIRTYASALTSYKDQAIHIFPIRGDYHHLNTVEVKSEINSSANEPIRVSYRLIRLGNVWRLYDMSVEGVSLLESFRSQFADILAAGSMEQLLKRLSVHNQHMS